MASQRQAMLMVLLLSAMAVAVSAGVYPVGGGRGWTFGSESAVSLSAGDTIKFSYDPTEHNVFQVSKDAFDGCQSSSPYAAYYSGNDNIPLPNWGAYYFICAVPGHCGAGMKLAVYVK